MRFGRWAAALAVAAGLAGSPVRAATLFGEQSFTLANGLQVVVVPNHRAPTVTQWVWYKVGAADEERGKSGAAHFLEHLMFRGTKTLKPKEFSALIAREGGQENAYTSWDYTAFHQVVAADKLELVMKLEADRMQNLVITDDQLKPERDVVMEEWRMRTGNQPSGLLEMQVDSALYLNHPYRIPVLGWLNEIKQLDVAAEKHFYDTWYAPNNAVLIVAGDVTVDQVRSLAEHYYGAIPPKTLPPRVRVGEPERYADTTVRLEDRRVRQPEWSRYFLAPSYRTAGDDQPYALQVLASILGGGATSRLHKSLVLDHNLAGDAAAWYEGSRFDLGRVGIAADARPGVTLDQIGTAAGDVVAALLKDGVTEDEVARAKKRLVTEELYAQDSLTDPVEIIGRALTTGRTLAQLDQWPDKIGAVTVADVNKAAHEIFDKKPSVTGLLLPVAGAPVEEEKMVPPSSGEIR